MDHEELLVNTFIVPRKRERAISFLKSPKKRQKFLDTLYHFDGLIEKFSEHILPDKQKDEIIYDTLTKLGAPDTCWVISTKDSIDGRELPLLEALQAITGEGEGSFLSCIPGKLAYFEGEAFGDRYILKHS